MEVKTGSFVGCLWGQKEYCPFCFSTLRETLTGRISPQLFVCLVSTRLLYTTPNPNTYNFHLAKVSDSRSQPLAVEFLSTALPSLPLPAYAVRAARRSRRVDRGNARHSPQCWLGLGWIPPRYPSLLSCPAFPPPLPSPCRPPPSSSLLPPTPPRHRRTAVASGI